ncbi:MAG: MFS transporter [Chloroflexi bacterium]|nr:MAG: MFS transporter [Chloroflexota bacterium]TMD74538.1 MAG: MFS transporter [Chloroflexota bacterium]
MAGRAGGDPAGAGDGGRTPANLAAPGLTTKRWILAAAVLGSGIVFLDSTVVNVALPRIGRDLPRTFLGVLEGQSYVYNAYLLTLSALLILAGAVTDFYGRKRTFLLGLLGFGVTSALCGFAPSMELLVLFRVLQGAAGALLVPGSLALLTANFEGEEQGRAFGTWAGASGATTILGPLLGGLLVDTISWRAAFFINIPLVALAAWATWKHVPESRDENATRHFDWIGAAIVGLAVGGLAFGTIYGQQRAWRDPLGFVALAIGVVATIVLPVWMSRAKHPLIPLELFRSRNFTVVNISTLLIYGALYVTFYYVGLFQQGTLGYAAAAAGAAGIPGSLFLIFLSRRFGSLATKYGPRIFMAVGPVIMALGVLWFARVPATSTPWKLLPNNPSTYWPPLSYFTDFLPGSIIFGIGICILVAPLTTALMTSVPVRNSGLGSAINNAISRVGPQLAGALIFVFLTANFYSSLAGRLSGVDVSSESFRNQVSPLNTPFDQHLIAVVRDASTSSFHLAMLIGAGLLLAGAIVNAVGIRNPKARQPATAEKEPVAA